MLDITRGRSLATQPPEGFVGDESFPPAAHQPPGLVPSELPRAACPINPRPRIPDQYTAACLAAEGDRVHELDACQVGPGARIWHMRRFATVTQAEQKRVSDITGSAFSGEAARNHVFVILRLDDADATGWLLAELGAPVYVLAPTPDAATAPGAGAPADESTAVRP